MIKIETNNRQVLDALNRLVAASANPADAMADIARLLRNAAEDSFQHEVDPWGNEWQELSEKTIARRRQGDGGSVLRILQDTGGLAASVTSSSGPDWAEIGAVKEYAAIHQFGGKAGRGKKTTIPPRPYLPFTAEGDLPSDLADEVLAIIQDHLDQAL